jgi:uncharacterized lipoprotein YddW (UPF0748 family)
MGLVRSVVRITCVVLAACLLGALIDDTPRAAERQGSPPETRALWVTRTTLTSPLSVAQMVRAARDGGFNTLMVQVRGRGDAYYRSTFEPRAAELAARPDFDPLAETLRLAHAAGLRVHAWLAVNLVASASDLPAARQHIIYRQPDWLMVPRALAADMLDIEPRSPEYVGKLARWSRAHATEVEGLYASPIHPWVTSHMASVAGELVTNYAVDGVHLDYVRFPGEAFDYGRAAMQQFKVAIRPQLSENERRRADAQEALNPLAYPDLFAERWETFRQSRLTTLVMRVRTAIKAARPSVVLSAAVVPDPAEAARSRLQDWRTWLDQSLLDVICPMAYTTDSELFAQQIRAAQDLAGRIPVWAGIGAYRLTPSATLDHIAAARRHRVPGIALFSYDALIAPPNSIASLAELGRAAFGTSH